VFREGKKSIASLLFANVQMFLILQRYSYRKRLQSNQLGMYMFYNIIGKVFLSKRKLETLRISCRLGKKSSQVLVPVLNGYTEFI